MFGPWVVVGIIVVIAVVSALGQVLKTQQEQAPRRPARGEGKENNNKNASGDIDRFLQELDKLRKKQAESTGSKTMDASVASTSTLVKPKGKQKPVVVAPVKGKPIKAAPAQKSRTMDQASLAMPVPQAAPQPTVVVVSQPTSTRTVPEENLPEMSGMPSMAMSQVQHRARTEPKSAVGKNLVTLLNSPQSAQLAFALSVVLGPPRCIQPMMPPMIDQPKKEQPPV